MSASMNYALLFGASSTSSTTPSLLSTLYPSANSTVAGAGGNPIQALQQAEQNETKDVATTAAEPQVKRDTDAFTKAVMGATSVSQLLRNPTVLKVLLTANGLGDQVSYTALAQKTLMSDPSNPKSLANTLSNTSWKTMTQTYDFASKGLSVIQNPAAIATITNGYAEYTWRASLDKTTPGLSNALTFRSNASTITSVDQILGDPVMRDVVTTTLGLPLQIALQPLEAQEKAVTSRLDIKQFSDPKFVDTFVQRYLIAKAGTATTSSTPTDLSSLAVQAHGLVV